MAILSSMTPHDPFLALAWSLGHAILTALVNRTAVNADITYDAFKLDLMRPAPARWVGRCKGCRGAHRVDGVQARGMRGHHAEQVVISGGRVYRTTEQGSNATAMVIACSSCKDRSVKLSRVFDDARPNRARHECNAKCLASTGPACECRCRGANHGSSAAAA